MRIPLLLAAAALLTAGCQDTATAPSAAHDAAPATAISDGAHNGTDGFYFLPPMVRMPAYGGTFDATLAPTVTVLDCGTDPDCAAPAATPHALFAGATAPTLDLPGENYGVAWHTNETGAVPGRYYRVVVAAGAVELGFADVQMVDNGKQLKNVDTDEYVGLTDGRTLPVKFRIETGAAEPPPPPPTPVAPNALFDEYSLVAGATLTVPIETGLLANDALGTPDASIVAVLGADGQPLGTRTILGGTLVVDMATGAFTLTGATVAGSEYFSYRIGNAAGTDDASIDITVTPGAPAMAVFSGDGQTAAAGAALLILPTVRVADTYGNPVSGVPVGFAVTAGNGEVGGDLALTDDDGLAAVGSWTLGDAGTNTLQATSTGFTAVDFNATALALESCTAGVPANSVVTPAAAATVSNTVTFTETRNVTVLVTDDCGDPVENVAVGWTATGSVFNASDAVSAAATVTAADGKSTIAWTYYYPCYTRTVSAAVTGIATASFSYVFSGCTSTGGGGIRR